MEQLRQSGMGGAKMFTKDDIEKMGAEGMSREVSKIYGVYTLYPNYQLPYLSYLINHIVCSSSLVVIGRKGQKRNQTTITIVRKRKKFK